MDLTLILTLAALTLLVAGAISLAGAWAAVIAGVALLVVCLVVDLEKLL